MNNLSPLVTIVTPTFNQAEFIVDTVESVLNQTYQYIEYLVIDDGSTDVTPELMRCYDKKLSYIQQENMGQAATLNRGWHLSAGQIIGYLSSDDCLKPTAVEELVKALLDSPDAILVYPDFDLIDASGNVFRQVQTEEFSIDRLEIDLVCQPGPGALFKKEIFKKISFNVKMDSLDLTSNHEIEEWALPYIRKVFNEVNDSNGKITNVSYNKFFIEIMSKISNLIRYDKISKDSIVTYSLPSQTDLLLKRSILFSTTFT